MHEVELKLQVPPSARRAVDAAVAGRTPARRLHLRAAYADTPGAALAGARMALRVRREGRHWVQTLKGAGEHSLQRFEHNVPRPDAAGGTAPNVDPALHRGTPVGERLLQLLEADAAVLTLRYETDVLRRTRVLRSAGAQIELAFDTGTLRSGDAEWPLCELELELLAGSPAALIAQGRRWIERHGLWIDTRSKAERGELLARGTRVAPSRTARATVLDRTMGADAAWRTVLRECTEQIGANASQIASGEFGDEHVHQLRVGLRRLRSAMQLFDFAAVDPGLAAPATALFRTLGVARDRSVVEGGFAAELRRALAALGARADGAAPAQSAQPGDAADADSAALCAQVRSSATQGLLLDLIAESIGPGGEPNDAASLATGAAAEPLAESLARRFKRWHAQAARDAKGYAQLDDSARHRLRKRIKRLRYAVEFCGALFDRKAVKRYLKPLRELQERLGAINDIGVAVAALAAGSVDDETHRWFALGWLSARRDLLVEQAAPALKAFAKADGFWRAR